MPLVVDASSPAAHETEHNTAMNTCDPFTPVSNALLLAVWSGDTNPTTSPGAPTIYSSPAQTWVRDSWEYRGSGSPTLPGQVAVFHSVVTGYPGSTQVTVTNAETTAGYMGSILKVFVYTGYDTTTPIGVSVADRITGVSSIGDSYTASISGSQGLMVCCDWTGNDWTVWTPTTGCTIVAASGVITALSYAVLARTSADGILGTLTSLGMTGIDPTSQWHWVVVEVISHDAVLAAATAAGYGGSANSPMF